MNTNLSNRDVSIPKNWDRSGLPGWTYHSPALLELEKDNVFRNHWQIACHISDIPDTGDYLTLDIFGERALIVRNKEGDVGAFHNICRHRGSRVVAEEKGRCKGAIVCPFHGWVYNLDGTLRGAAQPKSFPDMDKSEFGLLPLDAEIWNGLVFIRFENGPQPSVQELMGPVEAELNHYAMPDMVPAGGIWTHNSQVNWKSVRDVDNEGYHVALAHPALQDLYGQEYFDEPYVDGIARTTAKFNPAGGRLWSVKNYIKMSSPQNNLPDNLKKSWNYYGIFPNAVIAVTPESMQFYQEFPLSTGETVLRGAVYRYKEETRQQRLARYLSFRIDRDTLAEDVQLTIWSNESMASKAFSGFYLSDLEYGVRTHHDHLRASLPIYSLNEAPKEESITQINTEMAPE